MAVFSWLKYREEKLSLTAWGGMALGFLGVGAISYESLQTSNDIFLGTILILMASACAAYGVVIHKKKYSDVNIVVAANVQMICGVLLAEEQLTPLIVAGSGMILAGVLLVVRK